MTTVPGVGFANWYGFVNYLLYQSTDKLASNTRVELFDDAQGVRTGGKGLYTAVTQGFTWKPKPWLYVMPEVRYDYAARGRPFEGHQRPVHRRHRVHRAVVTPSVRSVPIWRCPRRSHGGAGDATGGGAPHGTRQPKSVGLGAVVPNDTSLERAEIRTLPLLQRGGRPQT